ncbi:MAG: thymidine phosphorylase [Acidobacteriota bacterium]
MFVDLIESKKAGERLTEEQILSLIDAYCGDRIPDYQMAAFLMAVRWRGLSDEETAALTRAMVRSGVSFDHSDIPGPKIDKHSTGGVGDKVSLVLAPLAAACGCIVPMVSGRGLGHTGGTLDKLESIPGLRTDLDAMTFRRLLAEIGVAMAAQTDELVPADRRLYALRSATATIDESGLITASILSKKIAEGAEALVLDVKVGSGAFMPRLEAARSLADRLCAVARIEALECTSLLTDMDQPLGRAVGNAVEAAEAIDTLKGDGPEDLRTLVLELMVEMLTLGGLASSHVKARDMAGEALTSGRALEVFTTLVERQGGDPAVVDDPQRLPQAAEKRALTPSRQGYIARLDARLVGEAALALGAGRGTKEAEIDPAAGLLLHAKRGDPVDPGTPWVTLHYGPAADLERALLKLAAAITIADGPPNEPGLIMERRG